ncbi:MAG: fatty acid desaturase, partial [Limnothrix sp.]
SFFLLPLFLSSLQLFFFGTYLPHRQGPKTYQPVTSSNRFQYLWSLVSCYHFGVYHQEHHAFPHKPWFMLPNSTLL